MHDPDYDDYEHDRNVDDDFCYDEEYLIDGVGFADPGGKSSLRAATEDNPRDQPCPQCDDDHVLTRIDVKRGYICNRCADRAERGGP